MAIFLVFALSSCAGHAPASGGGAGGADGTALKGGQRAGEDTGSTITGSTLRGSAVRVYFFVLHDCPICNAYAPEMNRMVADFPWAEFAVVDVDQDVPEAKLREHAREYGYSCPLVLDPKRELARKCGVGTVPSAAVVGANDEVVYEGRIDDRFPTFGKQRAAPTRRDLRIALEALAAGRAVVVSRTLAIGCTIQ
jgi:peroxiredoxin